MLVLLVDAAPEEFFNFKVTLEVEGVRIFSVLPLDWQLTTTVWETAGVGAGWRRRGFDGCSQSESGQAQTNLYLSVYR